jgi:YHS domain-containing protein/thioredoxin-related protein
MLLGMPRLHRPFLNTTSVLALVLAAITASSVRAGDLGEIAWREDYRSALDEAQTANRLLWIQFTGPWCPNCTRMERESFPDPAVAQHSRESFVPLKLRSDVHEQLAHNFNLSALPATIIVAPNREVLGMHQGFLGPAEFEAFLRDCVSRAPINRSKAESASARPPAQADASADIADGESEDRAALDGYCPVSLIRTGKLLSGSSDVTMMHAGKTYRFASRELLDLFRKEPERYAPANRGECPVTQLDRGKTVNGDPHWGVLFKNHLFLFASENDRRQFLKEPDRYAMVDVAEQGFCLHCIRESGLLVRGDPRHEVAREGRRYWFPDPGHREAFLASLR